MFEGATGLREIYSKLCDISLSVWCGSGLIHISNIARGLIHQVSDVFEIGEQIKMMAVESPVPNRVAFRYRLLCFGLFDILQSCLWD